MTRRLFGCAILLAPALLGAHVAWLLRSLDAQGALPALLGALLGVLAADAVTGLVHWACDTWGDERTRWIGPGLIRSFREHHRDPRAMLAHDWIFVNREPAIAAAALLAAMSLPGVQRGLEAHPALYAFACALVGYAAAANQLHRWAHTDAPARPVRWLQRIGLVLSPLRHARHHRAPRTSAYCISTGWLNPLLDRSGCWRALERAIARVSGIAPRAFEADERVE